MLARATDKPDVRRVDLVGIVASRPRSAAFIDSISCGLKEFRVV
jgi:hypothetical protein